MLALLSACTSGSSLPAPVIPDSGPYLIENYGGPVLASPWLVTLTCPGADDAGRLSGFGDYLPDSGWLKAVGGEYGVGLAGHTHYDVPVDCQRPESRQFTYAVGDLVDRGIAAGWWPADIGLGRTVLWMAYFSGPGDIRTDGTEVGGEHANQPLSDGGTRFLAWASCQRLHSCEWSASHELIESLTDPYFADTPAWQAPWLDRENEVADLCALPFEEGGFTLTRSWSNLAAREARDPCVPTGPNEPYETIWAPVRAVELSVGQKVTVHLLPKGPSTGWPINLSVQPVDLSAPPKPLIASLSSSRASPDSSLTLSIEAPAGSGGAYQRIFIINENFPRGSSNGMSGGIVTVLVRVR